MKACKGETKIGLAAARRAGWRRRPVRAGRKAALGGENEDRRMETAGNLLPRACEDSAAFLQIMVSFICTETGRFLQGT